MSELVANCPRCGANKMTFELISAIKARTRHGGYDEYEAFCICRNCRRSTTFVLVWKPYASRKSVDADDLAKITIAVNRYVDNHGPISLKVEVHCNPPEFVPPEIESVFREGAICMAVGCNNAAGTMFRLCIDLTTTKLLPESDEDGLNPRTRRDLGRRLSWLFRKNVLPQALEELSTCVREDGNDGAHRGTLTSEDAANLLDFTCLLLERIYTEPGRLKEAEERRQKRREKKV